MGIHLLTGAGFSRNWGGWVATEVFDYLLGCREVHQAPALRALLWRHQQKNGFESALAEVQRQYSRIQSGAYLTLLQELQSAINGMFEHMNRHLFSVEWELSRQSDRQITTFLARFDSIFTLNQDQLLEHHYWPELYRGPNQSAWLGLQLPATVRTNPQVADRHGQAGPRTLLNDQQTFRVEEGMQPLFKLHGSSGWSAPHMMGNAMILGDNKASDINYFPALNWYFERFEASLTEPGARLMIIGYGFRDPHINSSLIHAIREHGLKIFVIDPFGSEVAARLNPTVNAPIKGPPTILEEAFVEGLIGASRRSLREIFGNDSVEFAKILRFFEV